MTAPQERAPAAGNGEGAEVLAGGRDTIESTARPYQVMPDLDADEFAALKADIATNGVQVPVVVDQHGHILDGHHRAEIAAELGLDYPVEVREVADADQAREVALTLNLARRHLTREQRRELIASEIAARPDDSDRAIARRFGCDHKTVGSVRRELAGEVPHPEPERGDEYSEEYLAQLLVGHAEDRFHNAVDDDERQAWAEAVQLADNVWCWARSPLPNLFWFTLVAQHLYMGSTRLEVWRIFVPWLVPVARLGVEEAEHIRHQRGGDADLPGERLARLTIGLWGGDADDATRLTMLTAMDVQLAIALAEAEPVLPMMTRAQAETGAHP